MKNKYNNLLKYIYEYSDNIYSKETVNGLFRSILEPLIINQNIQSCVFLRILDKNDKNSIIKRLLFSGIEIYSFSDIALDFDLKNCECKNIWNNTEFIVVLAPRYSSALIWDYSECEIKNNTKICLLYNSRIISEIAKLISENSITDLKEYIKKYTPDRRENILLNKSINSITSILNDKHNEFIFSEKDYDLLTTAKSIEKKAKFIAHEIKNYLSIINLYSKISEKRLEKFNQQDESLNSINNSIKNIKNASENISYLINDLRCMSLPYKEKIKLKEIIEQTLELNKIKIKDANAILKISYIEDTEIETDKIKVCCAITNIIFNALDAKAKNIIIEANKNIIIIKNDGEKISEDIKEKIFEENFTTKTTGNGLGLAFCKEQLNRIGSDIKLIHSDNIETAFGIYIKS